MSTIAIVDSGGANIASVQFALNRLGVSSALTTDVDKIESADRVILPGVGNARDAMQRLRSAGLVDTIRALSQPVLGICLGMQLLCDGSAEDDVECLGIIPGVAEKLPASTDNPVPNMGWCATRTTAEHPILDQLADDSFFYFVHSYALPVSMATIAEADHAFPFSAMIAHENFVAAQFHPERSAAAGAQILANFLAYPV